MFVPECGISRVAESRILGGLDAGKINQINYVFNIVMAAIFVIFEGRK
jgi:hypothetical protein